MAKEYFGIEITIKQQHIYFNLLYKIYSLHNQQEGQKG